MARYGQHSPSRVAERLYRGMADPTARPGQQKNTLSLSHRSTLLDR
jgi:hypothetical protein